MRLFLGLLIGLFFVCGAASAESGSASMKALIDEMKGHAETEKSFREEKKKELTALESQIDSIRGEAKALGSAKDPDSVKPIQMKRLELIGEVARRDVQTAEQSLKFAERKLDIARLNLAAFEKKKSEALNSLGT